MACHLSAIPLLVLIHLKLYTCCTSQLSQIGVCTFHNQFISLVYPYIAFVVLGSLWANSSRRLVGSNKTQEHTWEGPAHISTNHMQHCAYDQMKISPTYASSIARCNGLWGDEMRKEIYIYIKNGLLDTGYHKLYRVNLIRRELSRLLA